jgi:hypothetical protein
MKELVEYIVSQLVEFKDEVNITEEGQVIKVRLAKSDMGKVIGRHGRIIKAIRAVVRAACPKDGAKVSVEIVEVE